MNQPEKTTVNMRLWKSEFSLISCHASTKLYDPFKYLAVDADSVLLKKVTFNQYIPMRQILWHKNSQTL
jgi:hypothetical protein